MNTTTIPNRSFFSIAAWYAVFAPFVAAGIMGIGLLIGIPDRHSDSSADYFFNTAALILASSALASIIGLFGIPRHGWRVIVWKSAVGFILSCIVYWMLLVIAFAEMAHQ